MPELPELDRLADDAPAGGAAFADRALAAAHRRRRGRLATAASALAVLLVVAVPLGLSAGTHTGRPGRQPGHSSTRPADRVADDVMIIAAGVRYLVSADTSGSLVAYIYTRTCGPGLMLDPCRSRAVERRDPIRNVLADRSFGLPVRVVWIDSAKGLLDEHGQLTHGGTIVTLGNVAMTGSTARLPIAATCGALCGHGMTLTLQRQADGTWDVTGHSGREWIS